MKLAFIGGGTMAEAIIHGVLAAKIASPGDIRVGEPLAERRQDLAQRYGVQAGPSNLEAAHGADLVLLAVKPQDLPRVYAQLNGRLVPEQAALSIVAGARLSTLVQGLDHAPVIRVMPNTPAQIGCGMSVWTCTGEVDQRQRGLAQSILSTVGQEIHVEDEKYLDMATALSGSGPAYVFLVIEALIDAGVYIGLPREMARTVTLQTIYGSTKLVMETGKHPAELKDMVVSPGGTTAEALRVLERSGVPAAFVEAVSAAYQKSVRLGEG
jgi:pyrroline-5-carboxylate reductase